MAGMQKTPVFIKIRGSKTKCQSFMNQVAQKNLNLKVSKFILMQHDNRETDLVLRFEVIDSV
jgi:hypothetical protein